MKKIHLILVLLFAFAVLTCTSGVASALSKYVGNTCALQMAVGKRAKDLVIEVKGDGSVISVDTQKILRIAVGLEEL